ncbi:hypothetical protein NKR23_g11927 [Pleurostoma richardsiae]|uniref:Uncharacterized protein n=1 Tax=Pleurostoma richardsiae TaxID=41990 RepID=A0AA38RHY8_9PEZI|nr:hypothetical protein NKR23_g11927 [Pleurostoma richardsiae]
MDYSSTRTLPAVSSLPCAPYSGGFVTIATPKRFDVIGMIPAVIASTLAQNVFVAVPDSSRRRALPMTGSTHYWIACRG